MPNQKLHARNILVTGAAGFIGAALCARLDALGAHVVGTGRGKPPPGFRGTWLQCELTDAAAVEGLVALSEPDFVFHLAGLTLGDQGTQAVWPNLRDNLLATVPLLLALTGTRCRRLVLTASLRDPEIATEPLPLSPYAAAKTASSAYARMFHQLYQLPVAIARLFMVYGPGPQDMDKLVPHVASRLAADLPAALSTGEARFDFVFIDDVVEGLLALATAQGVEGRTLDFGTGQLASIAEVAQTLARHLGKPDLLKFGALPDRRFEPLRAADTELTAALTGWRAKVPLAVGLERFLAWHEQQSAVPVAG